eukprot:1056889-Rhodomonas_salina.1
MERAERREAQREEGGAERREEEREQREQRGGDCREGGEEGGAVKPITHAAACSPWNARSCSMHCAVSFPCSMDCAVLFHGLCGLGPWIVRSCSMHCAVLAPPLLFPPRFSLLLSSSLLLSAAPLLRVLLAPPLVLSSPRFLLPTPLRCDDEHSPGRQRSPKHQTQVRIRTCLPARRPLLCSARLFLLSCVWSRSQR